MTRRPPSTIVGEHAALPKRMRINRKIRKLILEALHAARLTSCGVEEEHKQAMKLYLDTWVVARLERALEGIEGPKR